MSDLEQAEPSLTPSEPVVDSQTPNEFQDRWEAEQLVLEQAAASMEVESGQPPSFGAPDGSLAQGVTTSEQPTESFLSEEEKAQFNTDTPEYKAMQASFTRKMQELKARDEQSAGGEDATLRARIQRLEAEARGPQETQASPSEPTLSFESFRSSTPLAEELEPYRAELVGLVREAAMFTVNQLQQQAVEAQATEQKQELQAKLTTDLSALQNGPDAAEFNRHYQEVVAIASENPNLITRIGLQGIFDMARGGSSPAPQASGDSTQTYAAGVQDTLARMQARKTTAVENHQPVAGDLAEAPLGIPEGTSLNAAVQMAFQQAQRSNG